MKLGLWSVVFLAACDPRVSVGDLGESSGASGGAGGSKPSGVLPMAEAGAQAEALTGEAGAGGAGLAGPDEEIGGSSPSGGGSGGTGGTGWNPLEAYAPRSGPFKVLAYSRTAAYRHDGAIQSGQQLLQEIANEQGFELVVTEENAFLAELDSFELVFFLNTTGDVFNQQEQQTFEQWMLRGGAFVGTHSATDTENGWPFYSEVTGQYYEGHGPQGTPATIELDPTMLDHPALEGLPNPWEHTDEWMRFSAYPQWSVKPGFQILARDSESDMPVAWLREWGTFRAFYSAMGHGAEVFSNDQLFKHHLTGGIMWAVRREHLIQ